MKTQNIGLKLYLDEKKRKIMGQEGRKKALIKFDESNIIRLQIYLIKKYILMI